MDVYKIGTFSISVVVILHCFSGDLAYFDGLSETILTAALVKPKAGVFQPHIQYLLCLTTPVDVVLLGVSFNKPYEGRTVFQEYFQMFMLRLNFCLNKMR